MHIVFIEQAFVMKIILLIQDSRMLWGEIRCRKNSLLEISSKILQGSFKTIWSGTVAGTAQCSAEQVGLHMLRDEKFLSTYFSSRNLYVFNLHFLSW